MIISIAGYTLRSVLRHQYRLWSTKAKRVTAVTIISGTVKRAGADENVGSRGGDEVNENGGQCITPH